MLPAQLYHYTTPCSLNHLCFFSGTSESDTSSVEDLSDSAPPSSPSSSSSASTSSVSPSMSLPTTPNASTHPLHTLATSGALQKLQQHITDMNDSIDQPMSDGTTALYLAAENGHEGGKNGGN